MARLKLRWVEIGGGGYLVYFADGMCTSFRVSFSANYSKAGYLFYR